MLTNTINSTQKADISPGVSIRLYGSDHGIDYDVTYKLGDFAEYGSYNLSYYGHIVKICPKTIWIKERFGSEPRTHRLDIKTFSWRNNRWSTDRANERNAEISMSI